MNNRRIKRLICLRFLITAAVMGLLPDAAKAQPSNSVAGSVPRDVVMFIQKATRDTMPEVKDLPIRKEMPDVMTMNDGTKVTTVAQWRQRREEMKQILEHYELGHAPPPPGNVSGQEIQSRPVLDGAANFRLVHLKFGPGEKLGFDVAIFTPTNGGPFPTVINPSFFSTPGVGFTNNSVAQSTEVRTNMIVGSGRSSGFNNTIDLSWFRLGSSNNSASYQAVKAHALDREQLSQSTNQIETTTNSSTRPRFNFNAPVDPERAARGFTNQLNRGYAVVTYRYTQCGEDNTNFLCSSFYPAYPGYDWGVLYGWAWGLSRVVDYLETQPFADTNKLIALGHSRLGKLVMVATAFDERIAMGAPAGSAGAGTGAYRFCGPGRGGAEGIEDMTRKFPYYFVPRLAEFTGQMERLPFDAHWFVALTAPRPWISIEGMTDKICAPNAVKQTVLAARPVYEFLGVSPDRIGANFEPHGHGLPPEDWAAALDFADQHLRGMKVERTFNHFLPEQTNSIAPK